MQFHVAVLAAIVSNLFLQAFKPVSLVWLSKEETGLDGGHC